MKLIIENSLFASDQSSLTMLGLFRHGLAGRHRVFPEDDASRVFRAWLGRLGDIADEVRVSIDASFEAENLSPSAHEARAADVGTADFSGAVPRLPLADAETLLARTFRVVVEDGTSDRAFWLTVCSREQRILIERLERGGFLEFTHCGGLGRMETLPARLADDPVARLLYFFLFDSDALSPGIPSTASARLRARCGRLPAHQLRRRYAENYLPRNSLQSWAYAGHNRDIRAARSAVFQAFASLDEVQRHHYPMKTGLDGDEKGRLSNGETNGGLFDGLPAAAKNALGEGFGKDIGELYHPPGETVQETDLRHEGAWAELNPVVAQVLAAVR